MQFTTRTSILTVLTASLIPYVSADCHESGIDWHNKEAAKSMASQACTLLLSGTYGPEDTYNGQKVACLNTGDGNKIDFVIKHITEGNRDLPWAECYDGLQKEIGGCAKGGQSDYANWYYKADPNEGAC
ncbi:hypothetical protein V8F33_013669 [Rhypophila sp. PSN 637]